MSRLSREDLWKEMHQTRICGVIAVQNLWDLQEVLANPEVKSCGMLEFRHDYFEDLGKGILSQALSIIRARTSVPILYTLRMEEQGGHQHISQEEMQSLRHHALASMEIDLIDLEFEGLRSMEEVRQRAKAAKVLVLVSHHDMKMIPDEKQLLAKMMAMASDHTDADIVKAVYPAKDSWDLLVILGVSERLKHELKKPFVLLATGEEGIPSRYLGPVFGSFLTFASLSAPSALGQLSVAEVKNLLEFHRN